MLVSNRIIFRMVSQIFLLATYFYLSSAEWIEISKTPLHLNTKTAIEYEPDINNVTFSKKGIFENIKGEDEQRNVKNASREEQNINEIVFKDINSKDEQFLETKENMGFISYIEEIQSTLINNTHKGVKNKIGLLEHLNYNLLFNIKNRINNLWTPVSKREARGYYDKNEEHYMDFPSNEGALMTIGFLTFAVFLIKLVLKLIYALKNKNNSINTNSTPVIVGRRKRDTFNEEAIKILQLIEDFKFT